MLKIALPIEGIHRILHFSCCFLNTNTAKTRQLIRTARTLEAEWWKVCREALVRGKMKISQVLGAFGLLDLIMLRTVSLGARFETYGLFISLIFQICFRTAVNRGYGGVRLQCNSNTNKVHASEISLYTITS